MGRCFYLKNADTGDFALEISERQLDAIDELAAQASPAVLSVLAPFDHFNYRASVAETPEEAASENVETLTYSPKETAAALRALLKLAKTQPNASRAGLPIGSLETALRLVEQANPADLFDPFLGD